MNVTAVSRRGIIEPDLQALSNVRSESIVLSRIDDEWLQSFSSKDDFIILRIVVKSLSFDERFRSSSQRNSPNSGERGELDWSIE